MGQRGEVAASESVFSLSLLPSYLAESGQTSVTEQPLPLLPPSTAEDHELTGKCAVVPSDRCSAVQLLMLLKLLAGCHRAAVHIGIEHRAFSQISPIDRDTVSDEH